MITSVMIDSKEPPRIKAMTFGGVPVHVTSLEVGDVWATTDDGHILIIERKTPEDLLGSLKDGRLFQQAGAMAEKRIQDPTFFPYFVISGYLPCSKNGKVVTDRGETGWNYNAVESALLSIQEMGVPVIFYSGGFEDCVCRLGERKRDPETVIYPSRPPRLLGDGAAVLLSLPGIGPQMLNRIWEASGGSVAQALYLLTNPDAPSEIPQGTRNRIRKVLGLEKQEQFGLAFTPKGELYLTVDQAKEG